MTDIRDELPFFLLCAAVAWAEVAAETGQTPPDSELTKQRAYDLFERHKAEEQEQGRQIAQSSD